MIPIRNAQFPNEDLILYVQSNKTGSPFPQMPGGGPYLKLSFLFYKKSHIPTVPMGVNDEFPPPPSSEQRTLAAYVMEHVMGPGDDLACFLKLKGEPEYNPTRPLGPGNRPEFYTRTNIMLTFHQDAGFMIPRGNSPQAEELAHRLQAESSRWINQWFTKHDLA